MGEAKLDIGCTKVEVTMLEVVLEIVLVDVDVVSVVDVVPIDVMLSKIMFFDSPISYNYPQLIQIIFHNSFEVIHV